MSLTYFLIAAALAIAYFLFKRAGQIPQKAAAEHLKHGALVIDVRTEREFNSGHLSQAINMPLEEISALLPSKVKDKSKVLLLHCQSGMRSGAAKRQLTSLGYSNVFNLGSYNRALTIVSSKRQ